MGGVTHLPIFFDVFKLKMRETASGPDFGCVGAWWKSLKSLFPRKEPRNGKMATIYSGGSTFCGRVPSTRVPHHGPQDCACGNPVAALFSVCVRYTNKAPYYSFIFPFLY